MSQKLVIMQRLTKLLEGITTYEYTDADGAPRTATYDLQGKVYRGRKTVSADDATGALSIMEAPRANLGSPAGPSGQVRDYDWTLNIQGWPKEDRLNPSDPAYVMAAAVEKQLSRIYAVNPANGTTGEPGGPVDRDHYMLGVKSVHSIAVADSLVLPPQENLSAVAFFYIPITISFVKNARLTGV